MGDDKHVWVVERVSAAVEAVERGALAVRRRSRLVDHVWRAAVRYDEVNGWRLAAAIAYYGFFAALALAVLVFAVLGAALRGNDAVVQAVREYLQRNLPQLNVTTLFEASQQVRTLAIIALVVAGVGWVETLRSSQRAVWGLIEQPGHFVIRWLVDLAVFVGLAILLTISLAISAGLQDVVLRLAENWERSAVGTVLRGSSTLIAGGVDLLLAVAVLMGVPRLRIPLRRLAPSALLVVVGLWLLKTLGRWYVVRSQHNPAYRFVAAAVGLLLFMYLFNQLILFAAALAATSPHGTVMDLAAGPPPLKVGPPPAAVPAPQVAAASPTATGPPASP